jgi:hypothetical protein
MFLLIVASGTLFVDLIPGENMYKQKDSLGRELLAEEAVHGTLNSRSSNNFPSSSEKIALVIRNTCLPEENADSITDCCFSLGSEKAGDFLKNHFGHIE